MSVAEFRPIFPSLPVLIATLLVLLPGQGLAIHGQTVELSIPSPFAGNYDVRHDLEAAGLLESFRLHAGVTRSDAQQRQAAFLAAQLQLEDLIPDVIVSYGDGLISPELISAGLRPGARLSPARGDRLATLRSFMREHAGLYALSTDEIEGLEVIADYQNPNGGLGWLLLAQRINGLPVFRGEVRAAFLPDGSLFRTVGQLAGQVDPGALNSTPGELLPALRNALQACGALVPASLQGFHESSGARGQRVLSGLPGNVEVEAWPEYFPVEPGVLRLAWRFVVWQPHWAWSIIVDERSGDVLWRKRLTENQSESASYWVYARESAAPRWPAPDHPDGTEGRVVARVLDVRVGNEPPYDFNSLGWITDGTNVTDGNNVEAGLDRQSPNGVDDGGSPKGVPYRVFDFSINPAPGNPAPGTEPVSASYPPIMSSFQRAAVSNVFYWTNVFHDQLYRHGFTEQARNFQDDNFGRGGIAGDRVSAEVQDSASTDNASFATGPDGSRGRLQLHVFTGPTPARDSALDQTVIIHELAHGLSSRLIGNSAGLTSNRARSLGEGWSDFIAISLLQRSTDPQSGLYPIAAYVSRQYLDLGEQNAYYGIRRFPYALMSSTGGPHNRPHAPQTYADIDPVQIDLSDGAFPKNPAIGNSATAIHNAGEIWALALLEGRARLIERLGHELGNQTMLQYVVDGMKLSPLEPDFLDARDAVLAAALANNDLASVHDLWRGFAIRGMGVGASAEGTRVSESFNWPGVNPEAVSVVDSQCNANGWPDPGEAVRVLVPMSNQSGLDVNDVRVGINDGPVYSLGNVPAGISVSSDLPFIVPSELSCGANLPLSVSVVGSLGAQVFHYLFATGNPVVAYSENFSSVTVPALPGGWTSSTVGAASPWQTSSNNPSTPPNSAFVAGTSSSSESVLIAPSFQVLSAEASVRFQHSYKLELNYDGGILEVRIGAGAWTELLDAGGSFEAGGYEQVLTASCPGNPNPLGPRAAWTGDSNGYRTVIARLPEAAQGQQVTIRWRLGSDCSVASPQGWHVDQVLVVNDHQCHVPVCSDLIHRNGFQGLE